MKTKDKPITIKHCEAQALLTFIDNMTRERILLDWAVEDIPVKIATMLGSEDHRIDFIRARESLRHKINRMGRN